MSSPPWRIRAVGLSRRLRRAPLLRRLRSRGRTKDTTEASHARGGARRALQRACRAVGLDPVGAELIGRSVVSVYRLANAPVIVRIRRGSVAQEKALTQVRTARWLTEAGAPVTRLLDVDQLVDAGGYHATFWQAATEPALEWKMPRLGHALRKLHSLDPPGDLPDWMPFGTIHERITALDWMDPADCDWLARETDAAEQAYRDLRPSLSQGVIHGDAHIGNLLQSPDGEPVLCDLDSVARGPTLQDLVPTAVDAVRFGMWRRHQQLADAYGVDITADPAWPVLRRIRELSTTSFGLYKGREQPRFAGEAVYRLRTLRDGQDQARWQSYQL